MIDQAIKNLVKYWFQKERLNKTEHVFTRIPEGTYAYKRDQAGRKIWGKFPASVGVQEKYIL
ncbi:MAG: hypothetical protein HFG49_03470 [Lachnospiraceae bacterium]|nr:hypothetical protein [Lachnospiraceae bacterium]